MAGDPAYAKATWPAGELPATGWKSSVYEKEDATAGTKDSVVVYTDIEAAKAVKFSVYYVPASY